MPPRTPKPCRHPHCGGLTNDKSGYCEQHRHTGWETHQGGRTRHQRGYGSDWEKLRELVLRRDKHLCQACRREGLAVLGSDVDHIVAKEHGGTDALTNLECLCKPCHRHKTARERQKNPH